MIGERVISYYLGKESYRGIIVSIGPGNSAGVLKDDGWFFVDYLTALRLESKVKEEN